MAEEPLAKKRRKKKAGLLRLTRVEGLISEEEEEGVEGRGIWGRGVVGRCPFFRRTDKPLVFIYTDTNEANLLFLPRLVSLLYKAASGEGEEGLLLLLLPNAGKNSPSTMKMSTKFNQRSAVTFSLLKFLLLFLILLQQETSRVFQLCAGLNTPKTAITASSFNLPLPATVATRTQLSSAQLRLPLIYLCALFNVICK